MNLYIRADADEKIGAGHIMRCIALAQTWKDQDGAVTFISNCKSEALKKRIQREGFRFLALDNVCPDSSDRKNTLSILENKSYDQNKWLVLDGYHFTPDYQKAFRDAGIHLLVIDDMNHLPHYHADILLNQNIHAPDLKYMCDADTTLLLGTRYVLLRREFLKYRDFRRQIPDRARNILVTLGGGDPDNVTLEIIKALNLIEDPNIEARIVVGPANQNIEKLQKMLIVSPFTFRLLPNVSKMPELMAWADLAISGGGSTVWELAFIGLPNIMLILAENQRLIAESLYGANVAVNLGCQNKLTNEKIAEAIERMINNYDTRRKMSLRGQELVDGYGANTICKIIKEETL